MRNWINVIPNHIGIKYNKYKYIYIIICDEYFMYLHNPHLILVTKWDEAIKQRENLH